MTGTPVWTGFTGAAVEQPIASSKSNGSPVFRNRMTSPTNPVWSGGGGSPSGYWHRVGFARGEVRPAARVQHAMVGGRQNRSRIIQTHVDVGSALPVIRSGKTAFSKLLKEGKFPSVWSRGKSAKKRIYILEIRLGVYTLARALRAYAGRHWAISDCEYSSSPSETARACVSNRRTSRVGLST